MAIAMTFSRDTVDASYAACRRISRRAHSSFYAGFLLLPRAERRAMEALYAFLRHTDDLADDPPGQCARREALAAWREALRIALHEEEQRGEGRGAKGDAANDECGMMNDESPDIHHSSFIIHHFPLILPALADTVSRFHIPHGHLFAVVDGVEMDLDSPRYETFEQLQTYCERVASAVGLACIHIWGFRGPEAFEPARQAGIALQLTNILRDLKEDAAAGRVYLPLADVRACDYSIDDLKAGVADERFRQLMAVEIARAKQCYARAADLFDLLNPSGRRIFGLTMATYHALLGRIAHHPEIVFQGRTRLGRCQKLGLLARWFLLPPRKADLR
jgi:15-cis-phytoene synthase